MNEFISLPPEVCDPKISVLERAKLSALAQLLRRNFKGIANERMSNLSMDFSHYDHDATLKYLKELPRSQAFQEIAPPPVQAKALLKWMEDNLDASLDFAKMRAQRNVSREDLARSVHDALRGL